MFKYLNKGISTPIAIIIVLILAVAVGGYIYWQTSELQKEEVKLPEINPPKEKKELTLDTDCDVLPNKLDSCTEYKCQFIHPFTGEAMIREIIGIIDEKCNYVEEMPSNGKLECKYTESMRKAAAQYYKDVALAESFGTEIKGDLGGETEIKYTINGKEVENPLQEAMENGQCIISGY